MADAPQALPAKPPDRAPLERQGTAFDAHAGYGHALGSLHAPPSGVTARNGPWRCPPGKSLVLHCAPLR